MSHHRHRGWLHRVAVVLPAMLAAVGQGGCSVGQFFWDGVAAYEVKGIAVDTDSGHPLSGARIIMLAFGSRMDSRLGEPDAFATQTDSSGAFVLPEVQIGIGLAGGPPPGYITLEIESDGRLACAQITFVTTERSDSGADVVDLGEVAFDFTSGPCDLP